MFLTLVTINLLRGPGNEPSIVGIQRCTHFDWILFGLLLIASASITYLGIFNLRKEYNYKKSIDFPFVQGDFQCTNKNAIMLALLGIGGGFAMGGLGVGIGVFFLPALIQLDVHPTVAT